MARSQERPARGRTLWYAAAVFAAMAGGAAWLVAGSANPASHASTPQTPSTASPALSLATHPGQTALGDPETKPGTAPLPSSLDGTSPPRLPLDANGQLARTRAVRDFFDYFLTARNELDDAGLQAIVQRAIMAQPDATRAAAEAMMVWQQYGAYLKALAQLQHPSAGDPSGKPDFDALALALDQRAALASQSLGAWSEVFFGDELQQQRTDLARLRIASDPRLTSAEKAAGLSALEAALPPAERAARERARQQEASIEAITRMQAQGVATAEMRARITQTLGADAAERVVQMHSAEQAWQARFADYLAQRARIDALGLAREDHAAQAAQLRLRLFPNRSEALRAESLDRDASR